MLAKTCTNFLYRSYKVGKKDAMGLSMVNRGFSDTFMFSAKTTRKEIVGLENTNPKKCKRVNKKKICEKWLEKWTWAIPLEVIFLTPLQKWNPLNVPYKGKFNSKEGITVTANSRYGNCNKDNTLAAMNGTNSKNYYRTPIEFYSEAREGSTDAADTSRKYGVCVLTKGGQSRTMASGVRVFLPNIPGVGIMRTRFPIMPVHGEGSAVWKELNALKEIIMNPEAHKRMLWDGNAQTSNESEWQMSPSRKGKLQGTIL